MDNKYILEINNQNIKSVFFDSFNVVVYKRDVTFNAGTLDENLVAYIAEDIKEIYKKINFELRQVILVISPEKVKIKEIVAPKSFSQQREVTSSDIVELKKEVLASTRSGNNDFDLEVIDFVINSFEFDNRIIENIVGTTVIDFKVHGKLLLADKESSYNQIMKVEATGLKIQSVVIGDYIASHFSSFDKTLKDFYYFSIGENNIRIVDVSKGIENVLNLKVGYAQIYQNIIDKFDTLTADEKYLLPQIISFNYKTNYQFQNINLATLSNISKNFINDVINLIKREIKKFGIDDLNEKPLLFNSPLKEALNHEIAHLICESPIILSPTLVPINSNFYNNIYAALKFTDYELF